MFWCVIKCRLFIRHRVFCLSFWLIIDYFVRSIPEISCKLHFEMSASQQMLEFYLRYMSVIVAGSLSIVIVYYSSLKYQDPNDSIKKLFKSEKVLNIFFINVLFSSTLLLDFWEKRVSLSKSSTFFIWQRNNNKVFSKINESEKMKIQLFT